MKIKAKIEPKFFTGIQLLIMLILFFFVFLLRGKATDFNNPQNAALYGLILVTMIELQVIKHNLRKKIKAEAAAAIKADTKVGRRFKIKYSK